MNTAVLCPICPHGCRLSEGETGFCHARKNVGGKIIPTAYGKPCSIALDPMEKKPLYHFFPGTPILSLGTAGCNLHCRNCQNDSISQHSPEELPFQRLAPENVPSLMSRHHVLSCAYTYTEPLVSFEYILDCAKAVKKAGGYNVLVSAAYIREEKFAELLPFLDAANIDLKSMSDEFYKTNCSAHLNPVLNALKLTKKYPLVLEVTNLVIPTLNDTEEDFRLLTRFVRDELGEETPLHFSRYFPRYKLNIPYTPSATLQSAVDIAKAEGLKYVYRGNTEIDDHTYCSKCGEKLICREGYRIIFNKISHSTQNSSAGYCPSCGTRLYGSF